MKLWSLLFAGCFSVLSFAANLAEKRVGEEFKKSTRVAYYQAELEKHFGRKFKVDVNFEKLGAFCKAKNFVCEVNFFEGRLDSLQAALISIGKDEIGKKALAKISKIKMVQGKTQKASVKGDTLIWEEDFSSVQATSGLDAKIVKDLEGQL